MAAHDATSRSASVVAPATRPGVGLEAGAARAVFTWEGDRWSHTVTMAGGAPKAVPQPDAAVAWRSLDGPWPEDGDPRWPASPVLVELSRMDGTDGGPAILGVGMAGRSHFSASIVRDPRVADAVRFEIACRLHDGPGWLGSTYRYGPRLVRIEAASGEGGLPRTVVWSYSLGPQGIFGVVGATVSTPDA